MCPLGSIWAPLATHSTSRVRAPPTWPCMSQPSPPGALVLKHGGSFDSDSASAVGWAECTVCIRSNTELPLGIHGRCTAGPGRGGLIRPPRITWHMVRACLRALVCICHAYAMHAAPWPWPLRVGHPPPRAVCTTVYAQARMRMLARAIQTRAYAAGHAVLAPPFWHVHLVPYMHAQAQVRMHRCTLSTMYICQ